MRLSIAIAFLITMLLQNLNAQESNFPPGAYMNYLELKSKTPSLTAEFHAVKRSEGGKAMAGGSDYSIYSVDDVVSKLTIKNDIYAISINDTLYLNSMFQMRLKGYSKVITQGRYLVFYGPVNEPPGSLTYMGGAIGGAIDGAARAKKRELYLIDANGMYGLAKPINKGKLKNMLADYPSLLNEYQAEPEGENDEIMLKYLIKINEFE